MTSGRYDRRAETLAVLGTGGTIGLASGLVATTISQSPDATVLRGLMLFSNIVYWTLWAVMALAVLWLGRRVPLRGGHWRRALLFHGASSLAFGFVHMKTFTLLLMLWRAWRLAEEFSTITWLTDLRWLQRWQIEWEITMYWALVGLAHALQYRQESQQRALAAARLDAELSAARLQVLQQQIHPHFLFNTLQSISALMHRNVQAAEEMIERLGELLRGSLRPDSTTLVTLEEELEYVGHYLTIEILNIGDRLTVRQDVAEDVLRCRIPRLLLQPLVENAVRHGIAPAAKGGTLTITARRRADRLELSVTDTGVGLGGKTDGAGIALSNTRRRLELLYPDEHEFAISPGPDGSGVIVRLTLPAIEGDVSTSSAA